MVIGIFRYVERLSPQDKQIVSICVLYKFYEIKSIQKSKVGKGFVIRKWGGSIRYSLLDIGSGIRRGWKRSLPQAHFAVDCASLIKNHHPVRAFSPPGRGGGRQGDTSWEGRARVLVDNISLNMFVNESEAWKSMR